MVPPAGFEPAISTLKGWRPWPLDDGDSGKSIADFFSRSHIVGKLKNHHKGACPLCGGEVLGEELHGGVVGGVLVGVVEGLERQQSVGLCVAAALEGVRDQPVGELGVLGQCRSV